MPNNTSRRSSRPDTPSSRRTPSARAKASRSTPSTPRSRESITPPSPRRAADKAWKPRGKGFPKGSLQRAKACFQELCVRVAKEEHAATLGRNTSNAPYIPYGQRLHFSKEEEKEVLAEARSLRLLQTLLTQAQFDELLQSGSFTEVCKSGRVYQIHWQLVNNVTARDKEHAADPDVCGPREEICLSLDEHWYYGGAYGTDAYYQDKIANPLPPVGDLLTTIVLKLRSDEEGFRKEAVIFAYHA